jgi:lipopolysaccharide transport system ATP-binding protein
MSSVITVENLSKEYIIGHQKQERYTALRDVLANGAKRFTHKLCHPFAAPEIDPAHEEFWALKDVSFDIQQGDRVGIIGRNGAGKSTLLKILSRITEPTSGRISIKGRVASLLEVGTGFHPELTGRENIFLNGAILGMSKAEIKSKFNEIVAFAEVERFLDTPVKHYSSGMYVRLAFAVAAHLEPEILIVDEVLAVGDAQFQKKCLGKLDEVGNSGRTVLFVSHNMDAIRSLCNRGILVSEGQVAFDGKASDVISLYNKATENKLHSVTEYTQRGGSGGARITDVKICDNQLRPTETVVTNTSVTLYLEAALDAEYQQHKELEVGFAIDSAEGKRLATMVSSWTNDKIVSNGELLRVACRLPQTPFVPGKYLVSAAVLFQGGILDTIVHCGHFQITEDARDTHAIREREQGYLNILCKFDSVR